MMVLALGCVNRYKLMTLGLKVVHEGTGLSETANSLEDIPCQKI